MLFFGVPLLFGFVLSSECNQIIVETVSSSNFHGWAGFILHEWLDKLNWQ